MTVTIKDLAKYDVMIVVDKSGSMSTADIKGGKTRWTAAQEATEALARKAAEFDDDGIDVLTFNGHVKTYKGVTPEKVTQIFTEDSPSGGTDTAAALQTAIDLHFSRPNKPSIIAVITDGDAGDRDAVKQVIIKASKKIQADEELGITFLQVGNDTGARAFLKELDDGLEKQGAKFDIVDTKTFDEMEDMSLTDVLLDSLND